MPRPLIQIEEVIQRRIREENENRKNDSAQTLRSFLAMLKTFDSEYKEKSVDTRHEKEISYSEQIPKIEHTNTNQKAFSQTATDNAGIATNLNITIEILQNLSYTFENN